MAAPEISGAETTKNKVVYAGETLIDLTEDTVTPATLKSGVTAHDASGAKITGTLDTTPPEESDINFWDYEGTLLYSWTFAELATKTELPPLPSHDGLVCQGWNWTLADLKATNRKMNVGAMYITDDGKTRVYITLEEGRTSPMLGVCPNGTVTVDWGDGTTPDTLTGTSISTLKWTPTHNYAAPGDYVISLTVTGSMGFYGGYQTNAYSGILRYSSGIDARNRVYQNAVQKVEIGSGVTSIGVYAFGNCYSLSSVSIPDSVTGIDAYAFGNCHSLFYVTIPDSVTSIGTYAFFYCYSLDSVAMPNGVTSIGSYTFGNCHSLSSVTMPDGVTSIGDYAFSNDYSLPFIDMPDGVTSIGKNAFVNCYSLPSVAMPGEIASIGGYTFANCYGARYFDFTACAVIPTLANASAFTGISADCEIRVPSTLVDEWKAATNWSSLADHIVGV